MTSISLSLLCIAGSISSIHSIFHAGQASFSYWHKKLLMSNEWKWSEKCIQVYVKKRPIQHILNLQCIITCCRLTLMLDDIKTPNIQQKSDIRAVWSLSSHMLLGAGWHISRSRQSVTGPMMNQIFISSHSSLIFTMLFTFWFVTMLLWCSIVRNTTVDIFLQIVTKTFWCLYHFG